MALCFLERVFGTFLPEFIFSVNEKGSFKKQVGFRNCFTAPQDKQFNSA